MGMWMLYQIGNPATGKKHFAGSAFPLSEFGFDTKKTIYVGIVAVLVNLAVAALLTLVLRAVRVADGVDGTTPDDYFADEGDPRVIPGTERDADSAREPVA
jgi:SSS family solute:Na+ symporter